MPPPTLNSEEPLIHYFRILIHEVHRIIFLPRAHPAKKATDSIQHYILPLTRSPSANNDGP